MKYLHATNGSAKRLYFVFCTISTCRCSICMEWLECERSPIAGWYGATYGYMAIDGHSKRNDRFCANWDCVGALYFGEIPSIVTAGDLFDFDERSSYSFKGADGGHASLYFSDSISGSSVGKFVVDTVVDEVVGQVVDEVYNQVVGGVVTAAVVGCVIC